MLKDYSIPAFGGIDQSKGENQISASDSPDACNMDTENGDLAVAKGYVKHLTAAVPGTGAIRRLYIWRDLVTIRYIVIAGTQVYAYVDTDATPAWKSIHTFAEEEGRPAFSGLRWDFLECKIGEKDYLIIANGERQMIKWDGESAAAELFGSGETVLTTTVSSYTSGTKTVVLAGSISDLAKARMLAVGINIANVTRQVTSVDQATKNVVLTAEGTPAPALGNAVTVRGGISNARVNFLAMYYGRLFACGDMDNPSRLYYSQVPGDKRSIEDWSADDASADSSGGYLEVGDTSRDPIVGLCALSNQLLIFKRSSIYRIIGDRPSTYRNTRVHAEVEQMVDSGLVLYGDTPFWMTSAGMYYHDGQTSMPTGRARRIRDLLSGARLTLCKATENRDRLYFTCRENDNDSYLDNAMIVYDALNKTYMMRRGFTVADIFAFGGTLYMINDARYIYRFNEGDDYDGVPIQAYWNTPLTDLNSKPGIKCLQELYFRGVAEQTNAAILVDARIGRNKQNYRVLMPEREEDVMEIPLKNEGRVFAFKLFNEAGLRWRIIGGMQALYELRNRTI